MEKDLMYREPVGQASFAITARIAMQLGRESISNSIVAILELVKNTFDADAENVQITFLGLETTHPVLVIEDDGIGMNQQQLTESWLVIGTDYKLLIPKSKQKKRVLTGEKGLGRLGLDRLCEKTLLQTFTEGDPLGLEVDIIWKKYEHTNAKLESIEHEMYRISRSMPDLVTGKPFTKTKGTRLILSGLKDEWVQKDLIKLHTELALLVSPFSGINDFHVSFFSDRTLDLNGQVISQNLLEAAEWKVEAKLDLREKSAFISYLMTSPNHEARFELPATDWSKVFPEMRNYLPKCGPVSFEFYYIPREEREALSLKKAQVDKFLDSNQGVRIYRDEFRVMPYGNPQGDGDWLGLGLRRTRSPGPVRGPLGGWKLGYNQVVGAVFIGREHNNALLDQTNREGIVEGPAFYDLRRFALNAVEFFEINRQKYEKAQGPKNTSKDEEFEKVRAAAEQSSKTSVEVVERLKGTVENAVENLAQSSRDVSTSKKVEEDLKILSFDVADALNQMVVNQEHLIRAVEKREEERQEEFQRQKDTLGNLASLGILSTTFGHETAAASNLVIAMSDELKSLIKQLVWTSQDIQKAIDESLDTIEYGAKKINMFANFTLKNVTRDKRQRTKIYLNDLIRKVFRTFSRALEEERKIEINLEFPAQVPAIHAFYIDWESILVNFITNSVWALEDTPEGKRKIRVRLKHEQNKLILSFADSGHGLAAGTADNIFIPTFSTKRNRDGDVVGTGMGLAIVQNFVEAYNGIMSVESPSELGGAEFHIEVPTYGGGKGE